MDIKPVREACDSGQGVPKICKRSALEKIWKERPTGAGPNKISGSGLAVVPAVTVRICAAHVEYVAQSVDVAS